MEADADDREVLLHLREQKLAWQERLMEEQQEKAVESVGTVEDRAAEAEERARRAYEECQAMDEVLQVEHEKLLDAEQMIEYLQDSLEEEKKSNADLRLRTRRLMGQELAALSLAELLSLQHEVLDAQRELSLHIARAAAGGQMIGKWQWQTEDGTFEAFSLEACMKIDGHVAHSEECFEVVNRGKRVRINVPSLEQEVVGGSGKRRRIRHADDIMLKEPSWVPQAAPVALVDVDPNTSDYTRVLQATFGAAGLVDQFLLVRVQRVQNTFLWRKFEAERRNIIQLRGAAEVHERTLFHGTRNHAPQEIVLRREGFMVDHAKDGLYGKGLYFAVQPCYSHAYVHYSHDGFGTKHYHLLMCRVLCGRSKKMGLRVDRTMTRLKLPPAQFDSVEGGPHHPHGVGPGPSCSNMFVIYQDAQVYPEFIVTYRGRGEFFTIEPQPST